MAAWLIQRRWLSAYYTPDTRVWRTRMLRDVSGLQSELGGAADAAEPGGAAAGATRAVAATS